MPRSPITTHILDIARGKPAAGVSVMLEIQEEGTWRELASARTDADGRAGNLLAESEKITPGVYRLTFDTSSYQATFNGEGFYPYVPIIFQVSDASQHYHIPLLLSQYGYSTYRGS